MKTRTGGFPIGFLRGGLGADGQDIEKVIAWMKENDLEVIDSIAPSEVKAVQDAGLRVGTLDLPDVRGMISPDAGRRREAVAANAECVRANAAFGPLRYMVVMLPEDPGRPRAENFGYMVESFSALIPTLQECQARISIEGWPGPGALCCTPETLRALFKECPSEAMGVNHDPSHLIRMSIDPLRFLQEFAPRVVHVHGKDTELLTENLYEFGNEQPPTFAQPVAFAGMHWRYTIPGHGMVRWTEVFRLLEAVGYSGCVCIELEDAHFWGTGEERKLGILQGARFLAGC